MRSIRGIKSISLIAVSLLMAFTFGCKKKETFNITGNWFIEALFADNITDALRISCVGETSEGDVYLDDGRKIGSYVVDGTIITIKIEIITNNREMGNFYSEYHGAAIDDDHMNGAVIAFFTRQTQINYIGTWTGIRE